MKANKNKIQKGLKKIELTEKYAEVLTKFMNGKRGIQISEDFGRLSTKTLCIKHNIPKPPIHWKRTQRLSYLISLALKNNNLPSNAKPTIISDYTNIASKEAAYDALVAKKAKAGELKLSRSLGKYEQKVMNKRIGWEIKRDASGNPVIKTDKDGKLLYDIESNLPLYKYTPKSTRPGLALRMHLLEEHKMKKWDNAHPEPTKDNVALNEDLFPKELLEAKKTEHRTMRYIHLENVRDFLAVKYCNAKRPLARPFRVFEVYKNTSGPNPCVCEVERWENAYCFAGLDKSTMDSILEKKLKSHLNHEKYHPMGDKTIGYKVYDNTGQLRVQLDIAA